MSAKYVRHNLIGGGTLFVVKYKDEVKDHYLATNANETFYISCVNHLHFEKSKIAKRKIHPKVREAVHKRYNGKCVRCGSTEHLTIDHIIPISKGGNMIKDNLQLMCYNCNQEKGAK